MSRTDHHRPWQIRAADRTDVKKNNPAYFYHCEWQHSSNGGECGERCGWTLPHWSFGGPPREYRRQVWWGPERTREREGLRSLADEYTTFGDILDDDFPCYQHRHQAAWLYW